MENKVNEKKNGLAIAGFVCSLCGFVTCGLTSFIGLILSIVGLAKSKDYNENGKGLSIAGIIIGAIFVLVYVLIFGVGIMETEDTSKTQNSNQTQEQTGQTEKQDKKEKFSLLEGYKGYAGDYNIGYYIEGYIQNNTGKEYSYVQVEFNLYDKDGAIIGTALDNISNLEANGKWKFKAASLITSDEVENVASYKLKEITGW